VKRHISKATILLILLITSSLYSQNASEVLKRSSDFFNSLKDFSLSFKVKTLYDITDEEKVYSGTLKIGQKDKFKLDHAELMMVSDGVTLWEYRKGHNQVLIKSLLDLESGFHSSEILFKYLKCEPLSVEKRMEKRVNYYVLTLDPTKQITYLKTMEVWLSADDYSPQRLKTIDVSDNASWYTITDFSKNPGLAQSTFTFTPDEKTEVIDMR